MGEQNIRYYEAGSRRIAAEDLARVAEAYRMTREQRTQFAVMLGLLDEEIGDNDSFPEDDQAELEAAVRDPSVQIALMTYMPDVRLENWRTSEKKFLLDLIRTARRQQRDR
jgi:hypothetical protein